MNECIFPAFRRIVGKRSMKVTCSNDYTRSYTCADIGRHINCSGSRVRLFLASLPKRAHIFTFFFFYLAFFFNKSEIQPLVI